MLKFIELTAIDLDIERNFRSPDEALQPETQLDDLEQPVAGPAPTPAPAGDPPGLYFPISVKAEDIREYYPRKAENNGTPRVGTRIVYENGSARPVKETYAEVKAKLASLNN